MSHESDRHEQLPGHTVESLQLALSDLQQPRGEIPLTTESAAVAAVLIGWHRGVRDTLGEDWETAHHPQNYAVHNADQSTLITQNNAARWLAHNLIGAGEFALAERTLGLILPCAAFEPGDNQAITRYIEAELAHHEGDLNRETELRSMASTSWQTASNRGEPLNAKLYAQNIAALEKCKRQLWDRDHPAHMRIVAASVIGPTASASEFGIEPFGENVLPKEASDAAEKGKGIL